MIKLKKYASVESVGDIYGPLIPHTPEDTLQAFDKKGIDGFISSRDLAYCQIKEFKELGKKLILEKRVELFKIGEELSKYKDNSSRDRVLYNELSKLKSSSFSFYTGYLSEGMFLSPTGETYLVSGIPKNNESKRISLGKGGKNEKGVKLHPHEFLRYVANLDQKIIHKKRKKPEKREVFNVASSLKGHKKVESWEDSSIIIPSKEIHKHGLSRWLYKDQAQEYGNYLQEIGLKEFAIGWRSYKHPPKLSDSQKHFIQEEFPKYLPLWVAPRYFEEESKEEKKLVISELKMYADYSPWDKKISHLISFGVKK